MSSSILTLTRTQRDLGVPWGATTELRKDGLTKSPVTYWDFTVDGRRLFDVLNAQAGGTLDYVGVIQDVWPVASVEGLERLLGEHSGDFADGRISLYVCPECGDLGCGAVTARLVIAEETVTWQRIGYQTDYEPEIQPLSAGVETFDVAFERAAYEQVLRAELDRYRPLATGFEYPHQRERRERRQRLTGWLTRFRRQS